MNTIDLTFCIDAKNEHEQLNEPCSCYRNYIYIANRFELIKVSFCKHWKDYILSNHAFTSGKYGNHNRISPKFGKRLLEILGINAISDEEIRPFYKIFDTNTTLKEIPTGAFYFYEPVLSLTGTLFFNKISFAEFFTEISKRMDITASFDDRETEYFVRKINPFYSIPNTEEKNRSYYNLKDRYNFQIDVFLELLYKISKKMENRKYLPIIETVNAVLKYKTKNQQNDSN